MYAVIRSGGKQYRVAPGDVIKIEKTTYDNGAIEFTDVLALSDGSGKVSTPGEGGAKVVGTVMEEGRGDKILVFHFKRKKQYKKLQGHRQAFTRVRINEISFEGQSFKAEPLKVQPAKKEKKPVEVKKTGPRSMKKGVGASHTSSPATAVKTATVKKVAKKKK